MTHTHALSSLSIVSYSFVQLSEQGCRKENENDQASKIQQRGFEPPPLTVPCFTTEFPRGIGKRGARREGGKEKGREGKRGAGRKGGEEGWRQGEREFLTCTGTTSNSLSSSSSCLRKTRFSSSYGRLVRLLPASWSRCRPWMAHTYGDSTSSWFCSKASTCNQGKEEPCQKRGGCSVDE